MKIGLIDVDGHNFPNLPLMKLSAYHKRQGDSVDWYSPLFSGHMDRVYMSKVFTFSNDYQYCINADEIVIGGTGHESEPYGIKGCKYLSELPPEIENIYPDYSLYPETTRNTAYGFLTRGCPCNCSFCLVSKKEGTQSVKVADLKSFWNGQKEIKLLDPNITACEDWETLFGQIIDSNTYVDFTQGLRMHMMTESKMEMIKQMKVKRLHFAWDNYDDKDILIPKFKQFKELTGWSKEKMTVYVLVNFNTNLEQDLERIYTKGFRLLAIRYGV